MAKQTTLKISIFEGATSEEISEVAFHAAKMIGEGYTSGDTGELRGWWELKNKKEGA
jgi:hypothetical protein